MQSFARIADYSKMRVQRESNGWEWSNEGDDVGRVNTERPLWGEEPGLWEGRWGRGSAMAEGGNAKLEVSGEDCDSAAAGTLSRKPALWLHRKFTAICTSPVALVSCISLTRTWISELTQSKAKMEAEER